MTKTAATVAYLRTSSAANVGEDKDSDKRQLAAITAYAKRAALRVVEPPFYDAAVSGADEIHTRPGFAAMLAYLAAHPEVRTILVEDAERFARDLIVQEIGFRMLQERGIALVAVNSPDSFLSDSPSAVLIRQVFGAVAQFNKAMVVLKLRGARDRKRAQTGKCEGRKSLRESRPEAVAMARKLYRRNPATGARRSLRDIAAALAEAGHVAGTGKPYTASAVQSLVLGPRQKAA